MFKKILLSILLIGISGMTYAKEVAVFAMGCFWCGESDFKDKKTHQPIPGIHSIIVGYAGGTEPDPTYKHHPGYKEAVKLEFDPQIISFSELLDIFWHNVDPFDETGQFCDKGFAYTSAIYYQDTAQNDLAKKTKKSIEKRFSKPVKTDIFPMTTFYPAEEYHQDYREKNPVRYTYYRWSCGRDQYLKTLWGPQ